MLLDSKKPQAHGINDSQTKLGQFYTLEDFIMQNKIGEGSFAKVYLVREKKTGAIFAAKILKQIFDENDTVQITNLSREVNIISKLNHPSVLKFILFSPINFKHKQKPVIITEFARNGTLKHIIDRDHEHKLNPILNDTYKLIVIYGIASGMKYLHDNNIIHRDLKTENILIDEFNFPKIADFGLSKIDHQRQESMSTASIEGFKGTPLYMAPESWIKAEYSKASDVYSFGIIVYEIMTFENPLNNLNFFELLSKVRQGICFEFDDSISESYKKLVNECISPNPEKRPTFSTILDQLVLDDGFITRTVNKKEYIEFVNIINECQYSFDNSKDIFSIKDFMKSQKKISINVKVFEKIEEKSFIIKEIINSEILPQKELCKLDEYSKKLVIEAESDISKQFIVAKSFIKGYAHFPINVQIGIKYLKISFKNGFKKSLYYYCKLLIKGEVIPQNFEKVKKLLKKFNETENDVSYCFLIGKILRKEKKYEDSILMFQKGIEKGDKRSMYEYGRMIMKGIIADKNNSKFYYEQAIEKGYLKTIFKYGMLLIEGKQMQKDLELGIEYICKAANCGYAPAMYRFSLMLHNGDIVPIDYNESLNYLSRAAEKGYVEAMCKYATELRKINGSNNTEILNISKELLLKACYKGNLESMYNYAMMIYNGDELTSNYNEAAKYMIYSVNNGYLDAIIQYGIMLIEGKGVVYNKEEALKYFKIAIEKGDIESIYYCGCIYDYDEIGIYNNERSLRFHIYIYTEEESLYSKQRDIENLNKALYYYKMAIDKGHVKAMNNYAFLLASFKDDCDEEAIRYFKMAADKGDSIAMYNYARMRYLSREDQEEAIKYYKMAINKGNSDAMIEYGIILISINKNEAFRLFKMAADAGNIGAMQYYSWFTKIYKNNKKEAAKYDKLSKTKGSLENRGEVLAIQLEMMHLNSSMCKWLYYKLLSEYGSVSGMYHYARILEFGKEVEVNIEKAFRYYQKAASQNHFLSMKRVANMLENGEGIEKNEKEAAKYYKTLAENGIIDEDIDKSLKTYFKSELFSIYKKAAYNGNINAIFKCAIMLEFGSGIPVNKEESLKFFHMASIRSNIYESFYLRIINEEGIILKQEDEALNYFNYALELLKMIEKNEEKEENSEENNIDEDEYNELQLSKKKYKLGVIDNLKIAADKGNEAAMYMYAHIISTYSTTNAYEIALKYFKIAIDKGNIDAMNDYADLQIKLKGRGAINDYKQYYKVAADAGNKKAMRSYANIIYDGEKDKEYNQNALKYYKMALDLNDAYSMFIYGIKIEKYEKEEAIKYYKMSADAGLEIAMIKFAYIIYDENKDKNYNKEAIEYYQKVSENKDAKEIFDDAHYIDNVDNSENLIKFYKLGIDAGDSSAIKNYCNFLKKPKDGAINYDELIKYYKIAINNGDIDALREYFFLLLDGTIIETDKMKEILYIKMAANKGITRAIIRYGSILQNGEGVPINKTLASQYYLMASRNGNAEAMYKYAKMVENGDGVEKDLKKAKMYYLMAAQNGNIESIHIYGIKFEEGDGIPIDKPKAMKLYHIGMIRGDLKCKEKYYKMMNEDKIALKEEDIINNYYNYAKELIEGNNASINQAEALKYFKLAADEGDSKSMYEYALILDKGNDDLVNKKEAFEYYIRAASYEYVKAFVKCAKMLQKGDGIPIDKVEAMKYYYMGKVRNNAKSKKRYELMLENGEAELSDEIKTNIELAYKMSDKENNQINKTKLFKKLQKAVHKEDINAMIRCGIMFEYGQKVPIDKEKALKYYHMASIRKNKYSKEKYLYMSNHEGIKLKEKDEIKNYVEYAYHLLKEYYVLKYDQKALKYFKLAARKGHVKSMYECARLLEMSYFIKPDIKEAIRYYKMAADNGHVKSMYKYGEKILRKEADVEIDSSEALIYFKMAADKGNLYGIFYYANMLFFGNGVPVDKKESVKYMELLADKGISNLNDIMIYYNNENNKPSDLYYMVKNEDSFDLIIHYADALNNGFGIPIDKKKAAKYYKIAADKGNIIAMANYAKMLLNGDGIPVNKKEAAIYFKKSADLGFNYSIANFFNMLFFGEGIPQNKKEALQYIKILVEKEEVNAIYFYAQMLNDGNEVPANKEEAAKYFKIAADKGNVNAMNKYGNMLEHGDGIDINIEEAIKYYKMGIKKGNSTSMLKYALILENNKIQKDESIKYIKFAAEKGNPDAVIKYNQIMEEKQKNLTQKSDSMTSISKNDLFCQKQTSDTNDSNIHKKQERKKHKKKHKSFVYSTDHSNIKLLIIKSFHFEIFKDNLCSANKIPLINQEDSKQRFALSNDSNIKKKKEIKKRHKRFIYSNDHSNIKLQIELLFHYEIQQAMMPNVSHSVKPTIIVPKFRDKHPASKPIIIIKK